MTYTILDCYTDEPAGLGVPHYLGTYPIIVGVKGRLELKKFYDIEVTGHMLRSLTGKVCVKREVVV